MLWLFALMLPPGPALSTVAHFTRALAVSEFLRGVGMLHARAILSPMFQNFGCDGKKFVILARTVNSSVPFGARLNRKLTLCSALIQTKGRRIGEASNPGPFRITSLNVGGAPGCWRALQHFASAQTDVLVLQEIRMKPNEWPSFLRKASSLGFIGYAQHGPSRRNNGCHQPCFNGGVAVLARKKTSSGSSFLFFQRKFSVACGGCGWSSCRHSLWPPPTGALRLPISPPLLLSILCRIPIIMPSFFSLLVTSTRKRTIVSWSNFSPPTADMFLLRGGFGEADSLGGPTRSRLFRHQSSSSSLFCRGRAGPAL